MLIATALRSAVVQALDGRTWAGAAVYDSAAGSLDDFVRDEPTPVLVVFTDDTDGGEGWLDIGTLSLTIEIAVTSKMVVSTDDGEESQLVRLITDPALEYTVDMISRQAMRALAEPVAANPWAEIVRRLAPTVTARKSRRGSVAKEGGVRFAGRQIDLTIDPLPEPLPKPDGPTGVWLDFLALADAVPDLVPLSLAIRAELTGGPAEDWEHARMRLGLSADRAAALQIVADPDAIAIAEIATDTAPDQDGDGVPETEVTS